MRSRKTLSQYCIKHNGLMMIAVHRVLPFSLRPANEDVALPPLTRAGCERRVFGASCMSGQEHSQSDGGLVASRPLPWLEARARLGCQTAGELGAPAISSIPNGCQGTSPHQQGRGTKVGEPYNVGIDVSIDRLDVAIRPGGRAFCVTNDAAGWAELVARLPRGTIAAIGLEPSGGYERGVVRACWQPACRCGGSTRPNCDSSPAQRALWRKMTASMRA